MFKRTMVLKVLVAQLAFVGFASVAATNSPSLIVRTSEFPTLESLAVGGRAKAPFIDMRTDAINASNYTPYPEAGNIEQRSGRLTKIMDSTALAYILDPANRTKYRARIYDHLKYWDINQNGNITAEMNINSWSATVPPTGAFFATLIAMDIVAGDPNTTPAQLALRNNFNALMERNGTPYVPAVAAVGSNPARPAVKATQGPAKFVTTQYEPYHLESLMSARALWALWKNGKNNNSALNEAVSIYKNHWLDHITEDGAYREFGGYALARAGEPTRYNKGVFHDVIVYSGIDPNWYSNPKMSKFYEWLGGYALAPNRYVWPIGDSSYAPFKADIHSPFDRAGNFSAKGLAYAEWQRNNVKPPAKLFSYLARARATGSAAPLEPTSKIYAQGAAYFRQPNGGVNSLAAVLTSQSPTTVENLGHRHRSANSLSMASFGEILLRGPGYNGFDAPASENLGFDFSYVNNKAVSENVAMFDYDPEFGDATQQNPSWRNNHQRKDGGYGITGLLSPTLDYATSETGLLTDPDRAIRNGRHIRHAIAVYPQDGVNGYMYSMDELEGLPTTTMGQLAWHPYSSEITFNANNASNNRYTWKIRQNANKVDQLNLSIFMPTPPDNKRQYSGLFADDISGGSNTFVGKYILNGYNLDATTKARNVLTMFFPHKSASYVPTMERLTATGPGGVSSQAVAFNLSSNVTDYAFESSSNVEQVIPPSSYDPLGAAVQGKVAVYRKLTGERYASFYFVGKGTSFTNTPTGYGQGFRSDVPVDIMMKGNSGTVVVPAGGTRMTFYANGCSNTTQPPAVRVNGSLVTPTSGGRCWVRVIMPAGTNSVALTLN
jgi:hypothetical protein